MDSKDEKTEHPNSDAKVLGCATPITPACWVMLMGVLASNSFRGALVGKGGERGYLIDVPTPSKCSIQTTMTSVRSDCLRTTIERRTVDSSPFRSCNENIY